MTNHLPFQLGGKRSNNWIYYHYYYQHQFMLYFLYPLAKKSPPRHFIASCSFVLLLLLMFPAPREQPLVGNWNILLCMICVNYNSKTMWIRNWLIQCLFHKTLRHWIYIIKHETLVKCNDKRLFIFKHTVSKGIYWMKVQYELERASCALMWYGIPMSHTA